jgi:hypothetical protein
VSHSPTLPLSHSTSILSHYGFHSAMTWRWNNVVENYVLINRLLPQVQNTLWICAENILNSRFSILSKMARWLRHRRGDVGRPPSDALFVLSYRLWRARRIKDLHVTGLKTVLTKLMLISNILINLIDSSATLPKPKQGIKEK